jgi:hypothetical protein
MLGAFGLAEFIPTHEPLDGLTLAKIAGLAPPTRWFVVVSPKDNP